MNPKRLFAEVALMFGIGVLLLNFVILYQDNVIRKQRVVIKEMLQHCEGK